jgi:hypothetical protein
VKPGSSDGQHGKAAGRVPFAVGEQAEDSAFGAAVGGGVAEFLALAQIGEGGGDRDAFLVLRDDPRVDVGDAGHGRGVAEVAGHLLDDPGDGALAASRRLGGRYRDASPTAASTVACQVRKSLAV